MPRALLFDFNGVILNDEPQHFAALQRTLAEFRIPLGRATYDRDYLGLDDRDVFRRAMAQAGLRLDDTALGALIDRKHEYWKKEVGRAADLVPGVERFIRRAAEEQYRLAVVSGALRREVEMILRERDLRGAFACVVASEDVAAAKPDPAGYRRALALLDVAPSAAVALEDSLPGRDAARAAGIPCVLLATSHRAEHLGAEIVWDDFEGRDPTELPWQP